jgi:threonine synthase
MKDEELKLKDEKSMRFISTRGEAAPHSFSEAVSVGLAPDGGLFLPEKLPDFRAELPEWEALPYPELCYRFFRHFATDLEDRVLREIVERSYSGFDHPEIAPLVRLEDRLFVQELFHGPTLAFKDFALQLLGNLYEEQIRRTGKKINVLGATSGDTGAAAIHGLLGKEGVNIFILYPDGRVSPLQERQMTCTGADNVYPLAIGGTFDDAQAALKDVFGDATFSRNYGISAINSINLARILAQCVYYIYGYFRLPRDRRENVEFVVPTGNFGNVLAGWLAQKMGLPVTSFKIATNQNDILYRLFTSGTYKVGAVRPSLAPSMDIQVASNFERFLYFLVDSDPVRVREVMKALKVGGEFIFPQFKADTFGASRMDDEEIPAAIERVYRSFGYTADPHTVCGFKEIDPAKTSIVLSTASPAKFPDTIVRAIGVEPTHPSLEALKPRPVVKHPLAANPDAIKAFIAERARP